MGRFWIDNWLLAAISACVGIWLLVLVVASAPDEPSHERQGQYPGTETFTWTVHAAIDPAAHPNKAAAQARSEGNTPEWISAISSALALGVSIWAVLVVRGTLRAAVKANTGFSESSERQLRAYMAVDSSVVQRIDIVDAHGKPSGKFQINIGVIFKNTGQTPALGFSGASVSGVTTLAAIEADTLPPAESEKVIGAGGGVSNSKTRTAIYENQTLGSTLAAGNNAWFRSRHTYKDIFGVEWELVCCLKAFDMNQLLAPQGHTTLSPIKGQNFLRRLDGKEF